MEMTGGESIRSLYIFCAGDWGVGAGASGEQQHVELQCGLHAAAADARHARLRRGGELLFHSLRAPFPAHIHA